MVEQERPQVTIRRMRFENCVLKATHPHSEYITLLASATEAMVARKSFDVTLYVYCLSCWYILI